MAGEIPYVKDLQFEYGKLVSVAPNVRRVIARNPSPFTHVGTGTYVVGHRRVAVIDPGPANDDHVNALLAELGDEEVAQILVTHTHLDHSGAAQLLAAKTNAPTFGFGPHAAGQHQPEDKVEAGADWNFQPDHLLAEGDTLEGQAFQIEALHTPGHCSNHLCFALRDGKSLFTGDHVMGWATSVVVPPDGSMGDYMQQLRRLLARQDTRYLPTHGPVIEDPKPLVAAFIKHREAREQQILTCLNAGHRTIAEMVTHMYADVPAYLHPAAARSVFAHVLHLLEQGRVTTAGEPLLSGEFAVRT